MRGDRGRFSHTIQAMHASVRMDVHVVYKWPRIPTHAIYASPPQIAKKTVKQAERKKAPLAGFEIGFTPSNEVLLGR